MYLLTTDTVFGQVLQNYASSRPEPDKVEFELTKPGVAKTNWAMSTGFRFNQLSEKNHQYRGINSYGKVLREVVLAYGDGCRDYKVGPPDLWWREFREPDQQYKYTVIVLSDSQGKYMDIDQGFILPKGGSTLLKMAGHLQEWQDHNGKIDFSEFLYVIIEFGLNDCQDTWENCEEGLRLMKKVLKPVLLERQGLGFPSVLWSLPFEIPSLATEIREYVDWITEELQDLVALGLVIVNWRDNNPFLDNAGHYVEEYFESWLHLGHRGLGIVYKEWANHLPGLKFVNYQLNAENYAQKETLPRPYFKVGGTGN
jgi:hypothetical protein